MLALGDSLTYGTGATQDTSYPSMLALATGWRVVNAGVPGETAAQGCLRLPALLDEHAPQLVLVLLGGNDFLRRLPEEGVKSALSACVEVARAKRIAIALIPVPRFGTTGLVNSTLYSDAGKAWDVPVVDAALATLLGQPAMRADRVHLNADGYRSMALTIAESLRLQGWLAR